MHRVHQRPHRAHQEHRAEPRPSGGRRRTTPARGGLRLVARGETHHAGSPTAGRSDASPASGTPLGPGGDLGLSERIGYPPDAGRLQVFGPPLPPGGGGRWRGWLGGLRRRGDAGMSTAEYAVGMIAAVAFAGILFKIVTSPTVQQALSAVITKALKS